MNNPLPNTAQILGGFLLFSSVSFHTITNQNTKTGKKETPAEVGRCPSNPLSMRFSYLPKYLSKSPSKAQP